MSSPGTGPNRIQKALLAFLWYGDPGERPAVEALTESDWAELVREARRHGLAPLLHHKLQGIVPAVEIPAEARMALAKAYLMNAAANRRRFHYLGVALKALADAHIPVIVLKGAYLAEAVYKNIALRTMSDVDLLVAKGDLPAAALALRSAGFIPKERHLEPPEDDNEFHFVHESSRVMVELHWQLFKPKYSFSLPSDSAWGRARPARVVSIDVLTLSPEDLLVHLCIHAVIHAFEMGLKALCDIAEICAGLPVDWKRLSEQAADENAVRPAWLMLSLARRLLGAAVPEDEILSLSPGQYREKIFLAAQSVLFFRSSLRPGIKAMRPREILFFGRKRFADRIRLVSALLLPSRRSLAQDYHGRPDSIFIYSYYPLWMAKCLQRAIPVLWAKLIGCQKSSSTAVFRNNAAKLMDWVIPISSSAASSVPGRRRSAQPSERRP